MGKLPGTLSARKWKTPSSESVKLLMLLFVLDWLTNPFYMNLSKATNCMIAGVDV